MNPERSGFGVGVEQDTAKVAGLVDLFRKAFGLHHWQFDVCAGPDLVFADKTAVAEIRHTTYHRSMLFVRTSAPLTGAYAVGHDDDRVVRSVAHEVAHVALLDLSRAAEIAIDAAPKNQRGMLDDMHALALEQAVDRLSLMAVRLVAVASQNSRAMLDDVIEGPFGGVRALPGWADYLAGEREQA